MTNSGKWTARIIEAAVFAAFMGLLFIYVFQPNWDIDIFWHMETGEWISAHGELPHTDIYSAVDKTRAWTPFQWLYEVLVYQTNARLGFGVVRLMHALLYMGAFAGFYLVYRRRLGSATTALAMLMLTLVLAEDRFRVRPEAFNFFFTALVLPLLLECAVTTRARPGAVRIALTAILAVGWASLHSGGALTLLLGAGMMFGGALLTFLALRDDESRRRLTYTSWIFGAAAIPMLLTPGFVSGVITAFTLVDKSKLLIPEWHPPASYFMPSMGGKLTVHTFLCGTLPYIVFGWAMLSTALKLVRLIGAGIRRMTQKKAGGEAEAGGFDNRTELGLRLTALFFSALPVTSSRFVYMTPFAVFFLIYAGRGFYLDNFRRMSVKLVFMVLAIFLGLASYQYSIAGYKGGLQKAVDLMALDNEPGRFPERASDAVASMGLEGRIFHFTSWGGYLIYRHFPKCDVFTDGRGNFTLEEREVLIESHKPWSREQGLEAAWEKYPFEIAIFPAPVFPLLTWDRTKWMLVYRDDQAEVFLRVSPENRENIKRAVKWWGAMGIEADDPIAFQDHYRIVRGLMKLEDPAIDRKLASAAGRARQKDNIPNRTSGLFDGAEILFSVGLYERSEGFFKKILDQGIRHSSAALYVAWCQYLAGRHDLARATLVHNFSSEEIAVLPDRGPLKWAGRKILDELGIRLGLNKPQDVVH